MCANVQITINYKQHLHKNKSTWITDVPEKIGSTTEKKKSFDKIQKLYQLRFAYQHHYYLAIVAPAIGGARPPDALAATSTVPSWAALATATHSTQKWCSKQKTVFLILLRRNRQRINCSSSRNDGNCLYKTSPSSRSGGLLREVARMGVSQHRKQLLGEGKEAEQENGEQAKRGDGHGDHFGC